MLFRGSVTGRSPDECRTRRALAFAGARLRTAPDRAGPVDATEHPEGSTQSLARFVPARFGHDTRAGSAGRVQPGVFLEGGRWHCGCLDQPGHAALTGGPHGRRRDGAATERESRFTPSSYYGGLLVSAGTGRATPAPRM